MNVYNEGGQRHGYWECYWLNGNLECKGNFINGKRHLYWEAYYRNGKLEVKEFYL